MKKGIFWALTAYILFNEGKWILWYGRAERSYEVLAIMAGISVMWLYAYGHEEFADRVWRWLRVFVIGWFVINLAHWWDFLTLTTSNEWRGFQIMVRGMLAMHVLLLVGIRFFSRTRNMELGWRRNERQEPDEFQYLGERLPRHTKEDK